MSIQAVGGNATPSVSMSAAASAAQSAAGTSSAGKTASLSSPQGSYTVNISNAARAALAEFAETSVQTAQEAGRGDHQAQRLLATEQAAKSA